MWCGWVNSYANEWEDLPNHWGTAHFSFSWQRLGTVLPPLGVPFSLKIGDQGLVESDLSSWTHLISISLCYALGLCHSFKSCALPTSLLFHALFLSPTQAHNVASTIFWRDNQKIAGPWRGKYCIISNPSRYSGLHLPCFLEHVQHQHLSGDPLGRVMGTQCLREVPLSASLQRQLGFQG